MRSYTSEGLEDFGSLSRRLSFHLNQIGERRNAIKINVGEVVAFFRKQKVESVGTIFVFFDLPLELSFASEYMSGFRFSSGCEIDFHRMVQFNTYGASPCFLAQFEALGKKASVNDWELAELVLGYSKRVESPCVVKGR